MSAPTRDRAAEGRDEIVSHLRTIPIIDSDAHVTEPPDLWTSRVSKKYGDDVPHIKTIMRTTAGVVGNLGEGIAWVMGDEVIAGAPAGAHGRDELDIHPPSKPDTWDEVHPACYDSRERLKWMNDAGIYAQAIYPNVAGFGAQKFQKVRDTDFRIELVRAYNDFLYDWASPAPERFILNMALPFWDVEESIKEVKRCHDRGFKGVLFASRTHIHGQPWVADRHWDRLYGAIEERGLPINFHIGTGQVEDAYTTWPGASRSVHFTIACCMQFIGNAQSLLELTMSGVLNRFPNLKFVSVESGVGFLPFVLEALDHEWLACRGWKENPEFGERPSELFKEHIYSCFWFEKIAPKLLLPYVREDRVLFETDFPHSTKLHPAQRIEDTLVDSTGGMTRELRERVLAGNAAELYHVKLPVDQSWRTKSY